MSDGIGQMMKDVMGQVADLPREIVSDVGGQLAVTDQAAKAIEQGNSSANSSQGDGNKIQKDFKTKAREEELRARLKSMIESEIDGYKQKRLENDQKRNEDWHEEVKVKKHQEQVERQKAQSRVAAMIYQQRAGSGEVGKRKG